MSTYGYVYVAQVGLGANMNQTVRAFKEAESYDGPSLVIGYAPCINHGIKGGMTHTQTRVKEAVDAGYWHLFRFDPRRADNGENPFVLDSKEPTADFREYILKENRFRSLQTLQPQIAEELYEKAEKDAKEKYEHYVRLANMEY